ncbi:FadR/GntR family transcriptional regulator [Devosia lacusdianchii]|uniref:FadR/GntR family transcriptional regulator n=1 Tax=Devosia lacusdianchii TaxID=2917991 RepID=UPI0023D9CB18|nr:FadR/GntR family transcriptional regulator [Devosia sp. JXJ CY 41]
MLPAHCEENTSLPVSDFSGEAPLKKAGLTELLVARILSLVTTGELKPGDQLPSERKLAETFDVSRPTLREAIRALDVLGVVEVRHGGGAFVSQLEASDLLGPLTFFLTLRASEVEKLYDARRLIEGEIAALAAAQATPADFDALTDLVDLQDAAKLEPAKYRELDTAFHRGLAELSGNDFLARAAQSLNILGQEFRKTASETPNVITTSITDHRAIIAALRAGDAEAARLAMATHMSHVLQSTQASMRAK